MNDVKILTLLGYFFLPPIAIAGALWIGAVLLKPSHTVDQYQQMIRQAEERAILLRDESPCNELPRFLRYLDRPNEDGKGVSEPTIWRFGNPREACLEEFHR